MASSWGLSWLTSWGVSWGDTGTQPVEVQPTGGHSWAYIRRKRRHEEDEALAVAAEVIAAVPARPKEKHVARVASILASLKQAEIDAERETARKAADEARALLARLEMERVQAQRIAEMVNAIMVLIAADEEEDEDFLLMAA